ncbi:MAG: M6 family metalloprotease domain-containing protein [Bacteroidales bacterium]
MNRHLLLIGFLLTQLTLFGIPAKRGYQLIQQPDGTSVSVQLAGDEHLHYYETLDGKIIIQDSDGFYKYAILQGGIMTSTGTIAHNPSDRSESEKQYLQQIKNEDILQSMNQIRTSRMKSRQATANKSSAFPSSGEVHGLVLLVQFSDKKFSVNSPLEAFKNHTNQDNYTANGATGSVRDYFISQSNGNFTPKFDVYGPITLTNTMAYYGANDRYGNDVRPATMVRDACQLAASTFDVDFSKYDLDNDGNVDLVYVVYAGYGEAQQGGANTIWPHAWDIAGESLSLTLNGKSVRKYACSSELMGNTGSNLDGIGTFCHEFSHCLGLPDLYDTYNSGGIFGMGEWDIMDSGSYNNNSKTPAGYSAFEKSSVGWLSLTELKTPQKVELEELHSSNEAYVIYSDQNSNEYFVLENRQRAGWDQYLPASGLLITHVDYLKSAWNNNIVNNTLGHQRVSLVPADNNLMVYNGNYTAYVESLLGDPYPGTSANTAFTDTSVPAAQLYTGGKLGKPITNITHENKIVTFNFMEEYLRSPDILAATDISETGFTANWTEIEGISSYTLRVSEVKGGEVIISEDFSKFTKGSEASPDVSDISSSLDKYMTKAGWQGSKLYQAGEICKLGSNKVPSGYLMSPELDFTAANGIITLYYTLKGKAAIQNGALISLFSDATGSTLVEKVTKNISAESIRECIVFENVPQKGCIKILLSGINYLDDVVIYTGDMSAKEPKTMARATELPLLIENLTTTSYAIDGLKPATTYAYQVLATKDATTSEWSDLIHVKTNVGSGITNTKTTARIQTVGNEVIITAAEGTFVNIYQINGISIYQGFTTNEPLSVTCQAGIYIIQTDNQTTKLIITD